MRASWWLLLLIPSTFCSLLALPDDILHSVTEYIDLKSADALNLRQSCRYFKSHVDAEVLNRSKRLISHELHNLQLQEVQFGLSILALRYFFDHKEPLSIRNIIDSLTGIRSSIRPNQQYHFYLKLLHRCPQLCQYLMSYYRDRFFRDFMVPSVVHFQYEDEIIKQLVQISGYPNLERLLSVLAASLKIPSASPFNDHQDLLLAINKLIERQRESQFVRDCHCGGNDFISLFMYLQQLECLVKGIWDHYTQRPSFNILIIGLDNAGKTTLLEQIKSLLSDKPDRDLPETAPTIGLNVSRCDFQGVICQFWDMGGGGDLKTLWQRYYQDAHAVFFVIDSSDQKRVQQASEAFAMLLSNESAEGVPVAVLANKQDILSDEDAVTLAISAIKEAFNPLMPQIEARESKVFSISAQKGTGVIEALEWLMKAIQNNSNHRPPNFI